MNQRQHRIRILAAVILFLCACFLNGCQKETGNGERGVTTSNSGITAKTEAKSYDASFTGVLREHNEDSKTITVYNPEAKESLLFEYTSGTDVRDKYGQARVMEELSLGEIVEAYYISASGKLTALAISDQGWTYNGVGNLKVDKTNYRMDISGQTYWYDDGLSLYSEGEEISLIDLNPRDLLSIKGIGSQICSITVTKGHGYIRLKNYADFVGGTIEVGYGIIIPIVKDMLIVAREGTYRVALENGELMAVQEVSIEPNEEIVLDLSGYHMEKERIGYVRFDIQPFGADLYINGIITDYSEPIELNYGKHKVQVTMNGYEDFNGVLTIGESTPTISINLSDGTAEVSKEEPSPSPLPEQSKAPDTKDDDKDTKEDGDTQIEESEEDENAKEENNEETTGTTSIDEDHTITIQAPAGARVYLNGSLKGTVPLSFTKEIGNHIIVLSQSGYMTKSYSVEVIDDGENVVLSFPDMLQSE